MSGLGGVGLLGGLQQVLVEPVGKAFDVFFHVGPAVLEAGLGFQGGGHPLLLGLGHEKFGLLDRHELAWRVDHDQSGITVPGVIQVIEPNIVKSVGLVVRIEKISALR